LVHDDLAAEPRRPIAQRAPLSDFRDAVTLAAYDYID
jgi:hypothetical protein